MSWLSNLHLSIACHNRATGNNCSTRQSDSVNDKPLIEPLTFLSRINCPMSMPRHLIASKPRVCFVRGAWCLEVGWTLRHLSWTDFARGRCEIIEKRSPGANIARSKWSPNKRRYSKQWVCSVLIILRKAASKKRLCYSYLTGGYTNGMNSICNLEQPKHLLLPRRIM